MSDRLFSTWSVTRPWTPGELRELSCAGYRGVRITDRVELDPFFANLLRHAAAARLRVRWRGQVPVDLVPRIRHLSPPYDATTGPAWRRPGPVGLAVRYGPGLVVVEDRRSGRYQRSVIQASDGRHRLLKDEGVRQATQLDHVLAEEGLVLLMNGWAVSLPIHPVR
jgi:hypothetical protein